MERKYNIESLPIDGSLDRFAISYTPEKFTEEELLLLKPFFTNVDKPIFITLGLPEEINAALDSRYSRSNKSKRRLFLDEYVKSIIYPEETSDWKKLSLEEQGEAKQNAIQFKEYIDFTNKNGGLNNINNTKRARNFFKKWLSDYGDDSIAEMGSGIHLSIEGVSSAVLEEIVSKRIGISPIVKSTRYVSFQEKGPDGQYQYIVPGEIAGSDLENGYREVMNELFDVYSNTSGPYLDYIKEQYPKDGEENDTSFERSRAAKRFDDLRELLPFATQNSMGLVGNGRSFEDLINRLLACSLGEARWVGKEILTEIDKVTPSFVERPKTSRGVVVQLYRQNVDVVRSEMTSEVIAALPEGELIRWSTLISSTPDADVEIIATFLHSGESRKNLNQIRETVKSLGQEKRAELLNKLLQERSFGKDEVNRQSDRFNKVTRAFENVHYLFEVFGRGGDMRDLHRHRMSTEEHPPYTVIWGYDVEREVENSPFSDQIKDVFEKVEDLYHKVEKRFGAEVAQYVVPFGFIQQWYVNLTAREIYWIGELRTGPQARPHYKEIVLDMVDQAIQKDPAVFAGIMVDRNDYRLSRRESEIKADRKKNL